MWNTCLSFSCKTCLSHNVIYFPTVCASLFLRLLVAVLLFQWLMYIGRNASPIKIHTSTRIKCCSPKQISLMAVCGNKFFVLICEESTLHLFKLNFASLQCLLCEAMIKFGNMNYDHLDQELHLCWWWWFMMVMVVTMLVIKFGKMKYDHLDQELHLKNLSMGSLLIILPFCPNLRKLTLKYPLR